MEREWRPAYSVPLLSLQGNDLAATVFDFDTAAPGDLYVGSFDGELAAATFVAPEGVDNPDFTRSVVQPHSSAVVALARSPFFPQILLSVGDWSFHLWRLGAPHALFSAGHASARYTAAAWSPTRAAVLFLGRSDGTVECWDLLDRTHAPALAAAVCPSAVCALAFNTAMASDKAQALALGDAEGMLRVCDVPSTLRREVPGENGAFGRFLEKQSAKVAELEARQVRCAPLWGIAVVCLCMRATRMLQVLRRVCFACLDVIMLHFDFFQTSAGDTCTVPARLDAHCFACACRPHATPPRGSKRQRSKPPRPPQPPPQKATSPCSRATMQHRPRCRRRKRRRTRS